MMKKLMVLSLVLAIGAVSSAALTLAVDKTELLPGEIATFTITSSKGADNTAGWGGWVGYLVVENGAGVLSNPIRITGDSGLSSANLYTEDGFGVGYEITVGSSPTAGAVSGQQYTFSFSSLVEGFTSVALFDDAVGYGAGDAVGRYAMTVVPEPMTMGLLSLGALFLRRRK
jgi:hypothetical protein